MTAGDRTAADDSPVGGRDGPGRGPVTVTELVLLTAGVGVVVVSWISLILATVSAHSAGAVVALSLLTMGILAVVVGMVDRPALTLDPAGMGLVAATGVVAAVMFFPGFPYATQDKDPGVYVGHGVAIAQEGSLTFEDPVLAAHRAGEIRVDLSSGGRFPGFWPDDRESSQLRPQFYHLLPALYATSYEVLDLSGIFHLNAALAALSVMTLVAVLQRAFGRIAAGIGGLLLATNMMQVWQAKFPTTEILTQVLIVGAVLGLVLSTQRRWHTAAAVAGVMTGMTFVARPDGVLFVLLGVAGLALATGFRLGGTRTTAYGVGLFLPLPHAFYQAYDLNATYSAVNDVPSRSLVLGLFALAAAGAIVWRYGIDRYARRWWAGRTVDPERLGRIGAYAFSALCALGIAAAYARPWLWGDVSVVRDGMVIRRWDERNLLRLSWFFTHLGIVTAWVGLTVMAFRDRWTARWLVILPGLVFTPLYVHQAHVADRLMWWVRRFIPVAVPFIVVLIAVAVAWAIGRTGRGRRTTAVIGIVVAAILVGVNLSQSLPLRSHREMGGSVGAVEWVAAQAPPGEGLIIFEGADWVYNPGRIFGGPVWILGGQTSIEAPPDFTQADIDAYRRAFPDLDPILVTKREFIPEPLDPADYELVAIHEWQMPFWEERSEDRPDQADELNLPANMWVWKPVDTLAVGEGAPS